MNPPEFLSTAIGSHDDKGDLYLEPEKYCLSLFHESWP